MYWSHQCGKKIEGILFHMLPHLKGQARKDCISLCLLVVQNSLHIDLIAKRQFLCNRLVNPSAQLTENSTLTNQISNVRPTWFLVNISIIFFITTIIVRTREYGVDLVIVHEELRNLLGEHQVISLSVLMQ